MSRGAARAATFTVVAVAKAGVSLQGGWEVSEGPSLGQLLWSLPSSTVKLFKKHLTPDFSPSIGCTCQIHDNGFHFKKREPLVIFKGTLRTRRSLTAT